MVAGRNTGTSECAMDEGSRKSTSKGKCEGKHNGGTLSAVRVQCNYLGFWP